MNYETIVRGRFISRPNRFLARVEIDGREETVHVKNTGRCRELLVPGADVFLEHHRDAREKGRKTEYSLIGVYKERGEHEPPIRVNMDSQAPNQVAAEWIQGGGLGSAEIANLRREVVYGQSRFDLAFTIGGHPAFMEVKGVTLERDGVAMFPDAPTERGVKHLHELAHAARHGFLAYVLFVIQMKGVHLFVPNCETHQAFADALREAADAGVQVLAWDCQVEEEGFRMDDPVAVKL